ncbi:Mur ligase [Cercophora newfieldiana]|uniref:Mur ligase n=1 Tax=Cercophora newfieldiana TaxID=92897 RepID=A0AA39XZC2_9PEZI|nr:Mur ligase [Cercophora newfieldiana]
MIDLGLARIGRLLQHTPQTWKAIHVAGTNGKGSICAYLSAMLCTSGVSCARFTSPHLVDRWDCIAVNDQPVSETVFRDAEEAVKQRDAEGRVGATEFELLTATAFEIFHRQSVEFGVIEVGLGGRLDATNILRQKAVTVVAKIGVDHQSFLGNTIEEIALQKAGIMRRGVPCVVDGSNQPSVLRVIEEHAKEVGAEVMYPSTSSVKEALSGAELEPHQIQNLACAHLAFTLARPEDKRSLAELLPLIRQLEWPGRLQKLSLQGVTGRQQDVLLDGAHNTQSAEVLAAYVQKHLRPQGQPVTWVLAATQGKDMDGILGLLLQPGDKVAAVRFGPVDGMPWVKATDPSELLRVAGNHGIDPSESYDGGDNVRDTLSWAAEAAAERPAPMAKPSHLIVVCGHAIWQGGPSKGWDESEWLIESYKKGETPTFIAHIKAGVEALSRDDHAVLAFSGGPTRRETQLSEARSYFNIAVANEWFGLISRDEWEDMIKSSRVLLEEKALDSYYNVLFSTVDFWRAHGAWPEYLTIVSHGFKRNRIVDGHCAAIGFPLESVNFVGINPPGLDGQVSGEKAEAMQGVQLTIGQWAEDPHGVGEELASKRRARNCWGVDQRLFFLDQERDQSGVATVTLEDGTEALTEGIGHLKRR